MTPHDEQYEAILALSELVEIDAIDPDDDLPFYLAHALNLHVEDLRADPKLSGLMAHLRTACSNKDHIARQMLDYIR